jgi:hypothetical protein
MASEDQIGDLTKSRDAIKCCLAKMLEEQADKRKDRVVRIDRPFKIICHAVFDSLFDC